jgi:hypothetical protein
MHNDEFKDHAIDYVNTIYSRVLAETILSKKEES